MNRNFERRRPFKEPLPKFYIVSEGTNTERDYFLRLAEHYNASTVEVVYIGPAGDPSKVAMEATRISRGRSRQYSFEKNDEVWAVFDCDTHEHYETSREKCAKAGVNLAYSDPCFELWIILHYQIYDRSDDEHAVQRFLETLDPSYDSKGAKICDFSRIANKVEDAEANAERLLASRIEQRRPRGRPSTTVHLLTAKLRGS